MPRSRNIKYSFFANDELAEIEPLGRILFIGLWTLANYNGDLEYKPKKIKAQILPYDNCDLEQIMINLDLSRFITIYNVKGVNYIHIDNFTKHQNPHPNEKKQGTDIPEFKPEHVQVVDSKGVAINHDKSRLISEQSLSRNADSCSLIPDSLIPDSLIPDSCSLHPDTGYLIPDKTLVELKPDDAKDIFEYWQKVMKHPRAAFDNKRKALIKKQLKHYSKHDLCKAIHGCSQTPHNMGENERGERYDGIELILREAKQIDRFMNNSDNPPGGKIKTIDKSMSEAQAQAQRVARQMGIEA